MLEELKGSVWQANVELVLKGLVVLTFGNVSGYDRASGLVAIKPSGVSYDALKARDIVLVDLSGKVVEGKLRPSSDTPTHLALYKAFPELRGISHAHSPAATAFAQAAAEIPCYGTTHADHFNGPVPVTRFLTKKEVEGEYEKNTGTVIIERYAELKTSPLEMPAVLVAGHGPFTMGLSPISAVRNALILEYIAHMALQTKQINPAVRRLPSYIREKHHQRKHGPDAYYGQRKEKP
ncbi:MAG: L-ribulose-5-phosphate 4-epimerase AraD [Candidatus Aminicenantes bacterium]|nr:L-ribulose-5-phosphate 4-epimerase AraD [Candidatus Aminicenantes bacterium]